MTIVERIAKNWWRLLLRGLFAIVFGICAFAWPGLTLLSLVLIFGIYSLVDGILEIGYAFMSKNWLMIIPGLLGIGVGIYAIAYPGLTAYALLMIIAIVFVVRGVFDIIAAIGLRKEISNEWLLIIGGVLSIIAGLILFSSPGSGALVMVWLIGAYALFFGVLMVIAAFRVRSLADRVESARANV